MISTLEPAGRGLALLAAVVVLAASGGTVWAERPAGPQLLPDTTVVLVSVANVPEVIERFQNTAIGRMSQDSQLKPLLGNLYGSLTEAAAKLEEEVGLSLSEILAIPQGEISVAVVTPDEAPPAVLVLLDVGNQIGNARRLLERLMARMDESGVRYDEETVAGTKLIIVAGSRAGQRNVLLEKDDTIVAGTDVEVVKQLLTVWDGGEGNTLADSPNFATMMRRCRGGDEPQLTWYVDPIELMRGIGQTNTGVRVGLALLPTLGLDGLMAIGGSATLDTERFDSLMHVHAWLDPPRTGVLKMIALEPGDSEPERWVPADVASYTTLHWNFEQTFQELTVLYDSFNGEGALSQLLESRFVQPTGLDLEKDLLPGLEGRVTHITWFQRPPTPQSQAQLVGLKLKDPEVFEQAVGKLFSLGAGRIAKEAWAGKTYYQVQVPEPEEQPANQRRPSPCFGILDDYLLMTDRVGLYKKVVTTLAEGSESLSNDLEFKLIASKIRRQSGGNSPAMTSFHRPEETVRWLYDLATSEQTRQRLGERAENNQFFKALNTALQQNPLPPFRVLRQYLAPGGAMVVNDQTGLHYMSFTLRRKSK